MLSKDVATGRLMNGAEIFMPGRSSRFKAFVPYVAHTRMITRWHHYSGTSPNFAAIGASVTPFLVLHRMNPDLGTGAATGRYGQIEAVEAFPLPAKVTRRASTENGGNLGELRIVVGIILLKVLGKAEAIVPRNA